MRTYLKNIIDSMPSVLVGVDRKGRVTEWNQSAVQGHRRADRAGQSDELFSELFPELESQLENMQEAIRSHRPRYAQSA